MVLLVEGEGVSWRHYQTYREGKHSQIFRRTEATALFHTDPKWSERARVGVRSYGCAVSHRTPDDRLAHRPFYESCRNVLSDV